jgi:hypothetical protein
MVSTDITYCSAMFCPLEDLCLRKSYIGKPTQESLSFDNLKHGLKYDEETDEWCCSEGIEVECK